MWTRNCPRIGAMGGKTSVALPEFQASRAGQGSVSVETGVNGKGRQSRCSAGLRRQKRLLVCGTRSCAAHALGSH